MESGLHARMKELNSHQKLTMYGHEVAEEKAVQTCVNEAEKQNDSSSMAKPNNFAHSSQVVHDLTG